MQGWRRPYELLCSFVQIEPVDPKDTIRGIDDLVVVDPADPGKH